jgi:hypothetical protein
MTIAEAIYLLCAATSLVAATLLMRRYLSSRTPLLLWSFVAFIGLAINNVLVFVDLVVAPAADLSVLRAFAGASAMCILLYGLIWEGRT